MLSVREIHTKADMDRFIGFVDKLNADDPLYVRDSKRDQKRFFNPTLNPFFKHAQVRFYLAERNGEIVGRICLIKNKNYLDHYGSPVGQFGFFDCIYDTEVAHSLFDQVKSDSATMGLSKLTGPANFSFNDSIGILYEGFGTSPFFEMPYNKPYYDQLLTQVGCRKAVDFLGYYIETRDFPDRLAKASPVLEKRFKMRDIHIRTFDPSQFEEEVAAMMRVYNKAWIENQGFVPVGAEEFQFCFKKYKPLLDKDLVFLAEHEGRVVGFLLSIPNWNEKELENNSLPRLSKLFGTNKRQPSTIRIMAMGVEQDFRGLGIDSYFLASLFQNARAMGYVAGEASRILESNEAMVNTMQRIDAEQYKKYRLYQLDVVP